MDKVLAQFKSQLGRPIVAVTNEKASGILRKSGDSSQLMDIGWSYYEPAYKARPAQAHMDAEAIEGLAAQDVLAIGSFSLKASAAVGTGELADRQRKAIYQG